MFIMSVAIIVCVVCVMHLVVTREQVHAGVSRTRMQYVAMPREERMQAQIYSPSFVRQDMSKMHRH